jgi:hypothetical protein
MKKDGIIFVYEDDNKNTYQYKLDDGLYYAPNSFLLESDVFTTVKGFQNGNVHYQFNKEFIKKLNLEVGRIRGWIKNPQDAAYEFDITLEEANEYWNSTFQALPQNLPHLLPSSKKSNDSIEEKEENNSSTINEEVLDDEKETDDSLVIDAIEIVSAEKNYSEKELEVFASGSLF